MIPPAYSGSVSFPRMRLPLVLGGWLLAALVPAVALAGTLTDAAFDSINSDELYQHVEVLADDLFEGRAVGTRGGYAAGQYLVQRLRRYPLIPAGTDGDYYQPFDGGGRNVLVLMPGTDPKLEDEVIVVGAHYDHVGRGSTQNSFGPLGQIHNGADDNASGVAALLQTIDALATTGLSTRRSILFAFWDGEEVGLVGSRHWLAHPTVTRESVKLAIHVDMIGRLRDGRLQVLGTRSGYGLRRLMCGPVDEPLWLDFSWELRANSDHWSFLEQQIPSVLLHTGLHEDYHRPTDTAERINANGMQTVSRYLLATLVKVAAKDELPTFRSGATHENAAMQRRAEQPLPKRSVDAWPAHLPLPRLGISWRRSAAEPGTVYLTRVVDGTPAAAAGLQVHDRIYEVNGRRFTDKEQFRRIVFQRLDRQAEEFTLKVERRGHVRTVRVSMTRGDSELATSVSEPTPAGSSIGGQ